MRSPTLARAAVIAILAVSGVVGAFATIAPGPDGQAVPPTTALVETLSIRANDALLPSPASYFREEPFQRGDTLASFLSRLGIEEAQVARLVRLRVLQTLRPGSLVNAEVRADGVPISLSFLGGRDTVVQIAPERDRYRVSEERALLETRIDMKSSVIRSSLFAAADAAGIPDNVAMQLGEVFGGDIDFHRDLRKGDRFTVVYEVHHLAGWPVRPGRVLAAEFVNQGRNYRAVHFGGGYYAPDGTNLRKAFLRSPLEFSRVTSGFGMRRHPIFQQWRAHQGIDYGAPAGTRVKATGNGVVAFSGRRSGYGNLVVLKHHGGYSTYYAHLQGFARGLRGGARVAQGDVIGYVGQTGWASGPHLHYEFHVHDQNRNPLTIAFPAAEPIPANELAAFTRSAEPLLARLDLLKNGDLALLE